MIVRILEDGQYDIDEQTAKGLEPLDVELEAAIKAGDEARFEAALASVIETVHFGGKRLDDTAIVPSELTLPHASATLEEVNGLLTSGEED